MNYSKLASHLTADPNSVGYAALIADKDWAGIVTAGTVANIDQLVPGTWCNARTIYDWFDTATKAEACLQAIKTLGATDDVVARVLDWMSPADGGIDMGLQKSRDAISALVVTGSPFTQAMADVLLAHGTKTVSDFEAAGLGDVYIGHLKTVEARYWSGN